MMTLTNSKILLSLTSLFVCCTAACTSSTQHQSESVKTARCEARTHARGWRSVKGCTEVTGDVRIEGTDARDLSELEGVRTIDGTLFIGGNSELRSLSGLEGLRSAHEVVIVNNPSLRNIDALSNVEQVERVSVAHNPELRVISGMDKVDRLQALLIMHNGTTRMSGFNGLVSAGDVTIADNPKLIYMTGLKQLTFVENLALDSNPRLAPVPGMFSNLSHVAATFLVSGCPGIQQGDAFGDTWAGQITSAPADSVTASR